MWDLYLASECRGDATTGADLSRIVWLRGPFCELPQSNPEPFLDQCRTRRRCRWHHREGSARRNRANRGLAWPSLSRSKGDIVADLNDAEASRAALAGARDVTHVFYAAYGPGGGLAEEDMRNSAMLRSLLDGLKATGAPVERVVLYQGAKVYGVHLGPVTTPFYEDENPRPIGPNFYFTQERELQLRRAAG